MIKAIIAVVLIIVFATIWSGIPDEKSKGNSNFNKDSFNKDAWKNYDIHHESCNHVVPDDFLRGKYNGIEYKKKK